MNIEIEINAGSCNGTMNLAILSNNDIIYSTTNVPKGKSIIQVDAIDNIEFLTSGKGPRDTIMQDGKILADKFIDIQYLKVSSFKLERYHLYHHFFDPYLSSNTQVKINLPNDDLLLYWYLGILEKHVTSSV